MSVPKVTETAEVKLGHWYLVPLAKWTSEYPSPRYFPPLTPVLGPLHEDAEIIGFPEAHWHIDWRFVPAAHWANAVGRRADQLWMAGATVLSQKNATAPLIWDRRKCVRPTPVFQNRRNMAPIVHWLLPLEAKYRSAIAKCRVCPHRGISLIGAPLEGDALVCPGHGLAWHKDTLQLVPRL